MDRCSVLLAFTAVAVAAFAEGPSLDGGSWGERDEILTYLRLQEAL